MEVKLVALRTALLILTCCYCAASMPLSIERASIDKALRLTPGNIQYWASSLHSSATIHKRVIMFGPGSNNDLLLQVPLGQIHPHATIVITVGLDKSHPNTRGTDFDPRIGISDGTNNNLISIKDLDNYPGAPCSLRDGEDDDTRVATETEVPSTFKLTFTPFYKYGVCETAQDGGYTNIGNFMTQLDITKPLFLRLYRDDGPEEYYFYYIQVEMF